MRGASTWRGLARVWSTALSCDEARGVGRRPAVTALWGGSDEQCGGSKGPRDRCALRGRRRHGPYRKGVDDESVGILDHVFHMDGDGESSLYIPAGGSIDP